VACGVSPHHPTGRGVLSQSETAVSGRWTSSLGKKSNRTTGRGVVHLKGRATKAGYSTIRRVSERGAPPALEKNVREPLEPRQEEHRTTGRGVLPQSKRL